MISQQNISHANHWRTVHCLAIIALVIRIIAAFTSEQIHHPDEIFQYLEQAHRLVFGYGYIPWEYRFGTRSWILPGFISIFLYVFKLLKIDEPVLYINFIKLVFCFISTSLVYSAYIATRGLASEKAGLIAAIFACFWYELIFFAHKPNPEVLATYLFVAALAIAVKKSDNCNPLWFGLCCALIIILRLQYAIPVSFLIIYVLFTWRGKDKLKSALVFLVVVIAAGSLDYLTWGKFFLSYYNNFVFNTIYNVASIFGTSPFYYYLNSITISSMGIFSITGLLGFVFWRKTWLPLLCASAVILSHSAIAHKEHRFIFLVIPLFLILTAIVLTKFPLRKTHLERKFIVLLMTVFFTVSFLGSLNKLPFDKYIYKKSIFYKNENLKAYLYLFKQNDVYGILNFTPWSITGGYYYLHKDIPIYPPDYFKLNDGKNYLPYITHIICPTYQKEISGFKTLIKLHKVEIRKQVAPPPEYKTFPDDTKNVMQEGVDDKYVPNL